MATDASFMEYLCEQADLGPRLTYQNDCSPDGEHL